MILCDLDDFANDARSLDDLDRLCRLREAIPTLKATLFTIPGRCSRVFLRNIKESYPWLDLVPHGWMHDTNRECERWTKEHCLQALEAARDHGLTTKGWKAPGWQISDGCYEALLEEGYWCADQEYNDFRRPKDLKTYVIETGGQVRFTNGTWEHMAMTSVAVGAMRRAFGKAPRTLVAGADVIRAIHGHIGHLGGHNANALELIYDSILEAGKADPDFRFIDEVMK